MVLLLESMFERCSVCVLRFLCGDGEVCRFGWCRCCGGCLDRWGDRWVTCHWCGFMNRRKMVRRLLSFG